MWLLGASGTVSGLVSVISELHLLFPEKANATPGASGSFSGLIFVICEWHLLFPEKANVTLVGLYLRVCVIYAISGIPDAWNQPNFRNLGPLVHLELFLYGISLEFARFAAFAFYTNPWNMHLVFMTLTLNIVITFKDFIPFHPYHSLKDCSHPSPH